MFDFVSRLFPPPIILASIPRCGSTYLFRKLVGAGPGGRFPRQYNTVFARNLEAMPRRRFIKTHALPSPTISKRSRIVFLFGDPYAAIASTLDKRFDKQHFLNCGFEGDRQPDLLHTDDLGYEAIFDAWMGFDALPVARLRYEAMAEHAGPLADFLGRNLDLSDFQHRERKIEDDMLPALERTYGRLRQKVEAADDFSISIPRE